MLPGDLASSPMAGMTPPHLPETPPAVLSRATQPWMPTVEEQDAAAEAYLDSARQHREMPPRRMLAA